MDNRIITIFKEIYGVEYESIIKQKLNNCKLVFYDKPKKINNQKRLDDSKFIDDVMIKKASGVVPNFNNNGDLFNTILINLNKEAENIYNVIVFHEINHVLGSNVNKNENGFHSIDYGLSVRNFDDEYNFLTHGVDYLDEVMNQYITVQAVKIINENHLNFYDNPNTAETYDTSLYEEVFPLMLPFLETYDKEIKEMYLLGNKEKFINLIGEANIEKLRNTLKNHFRPTKCDATIEDDTKENIENVFCKLDIMNDHSL